MLVTIGRHRLNLFNVTRFDHAERTVRFTDGEKLELSSEEADALLVYWDGHAEELDAKNKQNADTPEAPGRDFALGSETP